MGRDTLFFKGPPKIASKLSFPIFYVGIRKEARGKYVLWVEEMADPAAVGEENIIRDFASRLERDIHKQPALWLWSHKRWKHKIPQS
jgi:KDO2-lipid IV(A) lauroyltransferase